ncbi:MAG TPA: aldolase/citrate lyase family protein [Usitatibacter sp.]|jgi:4-hydroxy-2-oxoheptanedioate aldolase|nr:aldolase/citrate lyase family protein [Usitatibacter sp.]
MDLPKNNFKHAIRAGRQQIGLWVSLANPYSAELVAGSGFDWLVLDGEHSPNAPTTVISQLQAVAAYPVSAIVRPAWNDKVLIKRYLDIGAQSLLIPYVQNANEAAEAVAAIRYPTRGVRGVAGVTRASRFGRVADYAKRAEEELCLLVQIETREGLDSLEAIAKTDGVDGVFIGPADLAAALGHLGNQQHPEVQSAIQDAIKRIRGLGKPAGILATDEASTRRYIEWGTTFTAVGLDAMVLARETEKLAAKFR